jgi:protein gp37
MRLQAMGQPNYANGFKVTLHESALRKPLSWKKPRKVFVNSMSDLFHRDVPTEFIGRVLMVCREAHWHQFQILTKRSQRLATLATTLDWPPNVWIGVSVESDTYTFRIDHLRMVPTAIRFVSFEPLLGPITCADLTVIQWAIAGGESGAHSRPAHPDWFRSLRATCEKTNTAFFFKQYGDYAPANDWPDKNRILRLAIDGTVVSAADSAEQPTDALLVRVGKKKAGRVLDGGTWDAYPETANSIIA